MFMTLDYADCVSDVQAYQPFGWVQAGTTTLSTALRKGRQQGEQQSAMKQPRLNRGMHDRSSWTTCCVQCVLKQNVLGCLGWSLMANTVRQVIRLCRSTTNYTQRDVS